MMNFPAYYNEIDAACCRVLNHHIATGTLKGGHVDQRSIEEVTVDDVRDYRECHFFAGIGGFALGFARSIPEPDVTIWTGGFPCQDLSVAGRREGLAGKRSGLYFEFHRLIAGVQPGIVVIENVPGLLSSNSGKDFAIVIAGLTGVLYRVPENGWGNAGIAKGRLYSVAWRVLDAQFFGVAQRRRRVFIVASLNSGRAAEILFERESGTRDSQPGDAAGKRTAATVSASAPSRRNGGSASTDGHFIYAEQRSDQFSDASVASTLASRDGKGVRTMVAERSPTLGKESYSPTKSSSGQMVDFCIVEAIDVRNNRSNGDISGTLQAKENGSYSLNYQNPIVVKTDNTKSNGWGVLEGGTTHTLGGSQDVVALQLANGNMQEPMYKREQAWTVETRSRQAVHQNGVRRLTPTECERLQGFPDGWTAEQSDSQRYRQLGNAVCVSVAEWLGHRLSDLPLFAVAD